MQASGQGSDAVISPASGGSGSVVSSGELCVSAPAWMSAPVGIPPSAAHMQPLELELGASQQRGRAEAGPVAEAKEEQVHAASVDRPADDQLLWQGTTWDACPLWAACCAPLCCLTKHWRITRQAIDLEWGCCGSKADTTLMSRVRDISFAAHPMVRCLCCGRGTVNFHALDPTDPEMWLTTRHAKPLYRMLKAELETRNAGAPQMQAY